MNGVAQGVTTIPPFPTRAAASRQSTFLDIEIWRRSDETPPQTARNTRCESKRNLNNPFAIVTLILGLLSATPTQAHRIEGLLQAALVELLPSQAGLEVMLVPGMDIAPKVVALLDANGDGVFSASESNDWSGLFMAGQSVTVDGQSLPLTLQSVRTSSLSEMTNGHAEVVVHYTAELGTLAHGPRTIVCANRYEPIPSVYQCNGLVPKAPGVRIHSHRRDERQRELTLAAEFVDSSATAGPVALPAPVSSRLPTFPANYWFAGLGVAVVAATAVTLRRR
jgi:hypothetical protein